MEEYNYLSDKPRIPKSNSKKKFLFTMGFILLGVALVAALSYVALNTGFTKTLSVWFGEEGKETVSVTTASGDIGDSTISCEDGVCSTEDITLSPRVDSTCTITTTGDLTATYTEGIDDGVPFDVITPITFQIEYAGEVDAGSYPMETDINCVEKTE